jgi:serine/threonine protein kinase
MNAFSQADLSIDAPLPPGTSLRQGDFVVREVLGRGGFGITYRAQHRQSAANVPVSQSARDTLAADRQVVAIKEFFPAGCGRSGLDLQFTPDVGDARSAAEQESARQNFLNEARVLAALNHPGIVRVFAIFQENNTAYMVMELLEGLTLQEVVATRGPLPEDEALVCIEKVAAALGEVHRSNFIHRDIKAENIIVGPARPGQPGQAPDARVTLLDFGLNKEIGGAGTYHTLRLTKALRFGSPGYSPPEQYGRQARFGLYTDIYALGALLYYLLSGKLPPDAPERMSGEDLIPLHLLRPQISRTVSDAVTWALQLKGEARPQTLVEFLSALRHSNADTDAGRSAVLTPGPHPISQTPALPPAPIAATAAQAVAVAPTASAPPPQPQSPAMRQRARATFKDWVASLARRFLAFLARSFRSLLAAVARSLKRAARNLWLEFVSVAPRLLFLAAVIALGFFLVKQQQERRLQQREQWTRQRLQAKQNQAKKAKNKRAAKGSGTAKGRLRKRSQR